ncbi:MAG: putative sulfate exporter family transporter [Deltaproteobacteria bacterium]|nr:putative sulfate exporter family transporter [Deltaproteobacteria bacterium]
MKTYWALVALAAAALVAFDAPSWLALAVGLAVALAWRRDPPAKELKKLTTYALQLGVIALGAGMNLIVVLRTGLDGALITATSLALAIVIGLGLGKLLKVEGETPLMISVGTAICGGSAIAAVASVIKPKAHEMSVALAVVFVLNAVGLLVFPLLGHAMGLSQPVFGRWAALAIHDTSSVVGAGLAYGSVALAVATTTKLARALWIVPVTIATAIMRQREGGGLRDVKWPWFILGFIAMAAAVTWVPALARYAPYVSLAGKKSLVVALFLIGLSMSRSSIAKVGPRPFVMGVILWIIIAAASLLLATLP